MYHDFWPWIIQSVNCTCAGFATTGPTRTHFTSSSRAEMAVESAKSSFRMTGGLALEKPVPTTSQPPRWKAWSTCRPSSPVAPVTKARLAISGIWSCKGICTRSVVTCKELKLNCLEELKELVDWRRSNTFHGDGTHFVLQGERHKSTGLQCYTILQK